MLTVMGLGPTQMRARTEEASGEASESKRQKWVIKRSWSGSLNEGRWCIRTRGQRSSTSLSSEKMRLGSKEMGKREIESKGKKFFLWDKTLTVGPVCAEELQNCHWKLIFGN